MSWEPRFSVGLYHHFGPHFVDQPSNDEIDAAFVSLDRVPDVAGVEFFANTTVTPRNAAHIRRRLDERGLECSMLHHGEPYVRGVMTDAALTSPALPDRQTAVDMCLRAVEVAQALDAMGIYVFTPMDGADYPFQQDFAAARRYTIDALHEICEAAGNLKVALEFRPYAPRGWANVGSVSKALELVLAVDRPNLGIQLEVSHTLMSLENLAQSTWEAAHRGLLYHVHLNDTQLPQDLSTIFGSQHFWECLEMMYWLQETEYPHYLGLDVVWTREDGAGSGRQFIRNTQYMLRVLDAIDRPVLAEAMARNDVLATQDLLWTALRETS
ncbi:MAG TPA: sugar phosphate isomerase/epimerase family protein [Chloroflexota bacterium]|nr:sugar phosphate isomerase/epimerase family protein [Chloroflexota bacterium]